MTETRTQTQFEEVDQIVVRFAGDSGDGMQLTGDQLTRTTALMGNDLATFPDFPAEIRAPAGTLPGVSAFQLRFSNFDIHTPGDAPDVLVAMNPAALKVHVSSLRRDGTLIVDTTSFGPVDLKKAKYDKNPLEDGSLDGYRVIKLELQRLTREALASTTLDTRSKDRCKNIYALGIVSWLFHRDLKPTIQFLRGKFASKPEIAEANVKALEAGHLFAEVSGLFQAAYRVAPATFMKPGTYRNVMGNQALCLGLVAAAKKSGLRLVLGSYPITPASDILHQLATYKHHGILTFQAEDEIAAIGAAIGASYGGLLGVTSTSGPGLALKSEAIGLAVMTELPLVVIDVQRAGPSTGMPTKTEQADLLQAMFGRNGECPVPIVVARTPADSFGAAFDAVRIALRYMTPVILLSDGYIANGSEPWCVPTASSLPEIAVKFAAAGDGTARFRPYERDPVTLARVWARPGTPGCTHRIGGIEKEDGSGNISYDAQNHQHMVDLRAEKVARIANDIADAEVIGHPSPDVLFLCWGGTTGAITAAALRLSKAGHSIGAVCLRWVNPFPKNLEAILRASKRVIVPELNLGQLAMLIRSRFLVDAQPFTKVQGQPFTSHEVEEAGLAALAALRGQEVSR
ncbi:MAG: 2-oxoacid:acceptor oxidoreductase subunit alpha [Planctomycetes bacterium]|nr:2-oxoacid:acceptor oxidoreductase subunit alpha [Planctomycetota bacterium]